MLRHAQQWVAYLRFFLPFILLTGYASSALATDSLCAAVTIEIQQELTLERQAFDAHMHINNGLDTVSLENLSVNDTFVDSSGTAIEASSDPNNTTATFFIKPDSMNGGNAMDDAGTIAPS